MENKNDRSNNKKVSDKKNKLGSSPKTTILPSAAKKEEKEVKIKPTMPSGKGIAMVVFLMKLTFVLLMLLAIIVGSWMIYHLEQQQLINVGSLKKYQIDINSLKHQIKKDENIHQEQQTNLAAAFNNIELQIVTHNRRLRELSFPPKKSILLAKIEYLAWLADTHIAAKKSPDSVIKLLISVDLILSQLKDSNFEDARAAVVKSIFILRSTPVVDKEEIYAQLDELSSQLGELPVILDMQDFEPNIRDANSDILANGWKEKIISEIYSAFDRLRDLIRVKKLDEPQRPMPTKDERQYLKYRLAIIFEHTQMALLRDEQVIYKKSIKKARDALLDYYSGYRQLISYYINELTSLENQDIVQVFPDISIELKVLRDSINSQHPVIQKKAIDGDHQ